MVGDDQLAGATEPLAALEVESQDAGASESGDEQAKGSGDGDAGAAADGRCFRSSGVAKETPPRAGTASEAEQAEGETGDEQSPQPGIRRGSGVGVVMTKGNGSRWRGSHEGVWRRMWQQIERMRPDGLVTASSPGDRACRLICHCGEAEAECRRVRERHIGDPAKIGIGWPFLGGHDQHRAVRQRRAADGLPAMRAQACPSHRTGLRLPRFPCGGWTIAQEWHCVRTGRRRWAIAVRRQRDRAAI